MAVQDQNGLTRSQSGLSVGNGVSLSARLHSVSRIQLSDQFPSGNDYAPKVRKPYTITKQRERWTDEEHKKFLEALKLYGRAWRKIEEHVGTKTAVQIRSHAQKFFSKVLRDPNACSASTMESIEIPPPRPKRKPMHPYPRKLVELPNKEISNPEHPLRSNSLKSSDFDQENQSPKSVLSAVGSDTLGSTDPETPNGSSSPISSVSGVDTSGIVLSEPKLFAEKDGSPSPPGVKASPVLDEQSHMKFELFPKENISTIENAGESSNRTLKLFGATLSINGICQPSSSPTRKVCKTMPSETSEVKSFQTLPWSSMRTASSDVSAGSWSNMTRRAQGALYLKQLQSGKSELTKGSGAFTPWCNLSQLKPSVPLQKEEAESKNLHADVEDEKEVSYTGSSTSTVNDEMNGEKSEVETDSCLQSERSALSELEGMQKEYTKGFVPYKRCFAETENQSSIQTAEDREEQRIRLSL